MSDISALVNLSVLSLWEVPLDEFNELVKIMRDGEGPQREKASKIFLDWCKEVGSYSLSSFGLSNEEKEDIISTFIEKFLTSKRYPNSNPGSYISISIKNKGLNYIRLQGNSTNKVTQFNDSMENYPTPSNGNNPEIVTHYKLAHELVRGLRKYFPRTFDIGMRVSSGRNYKNVAEEFDVSPETVKSSKLRLKKRLNRKILIY